MRDAVGGVVPLFVVLFFIVVASGYMAYNVNYTKAFRMKDKVISLIEQHNGINDHSFESDVVSYADSIGYSTSDRISCNATEGEENYHDLFCYKKIDHQARCLDGSTSAYYSIKTKINLDIPFVNGILVSLRTFYVYGDTTLIHEKCDDGTGA